MSKERLEEIKEKLDFHIDWANNTYYAEVSEDELKEFWHFISKQTERVQELERTTSEYLYSSKYLLEQNKRYREAFHEIRRIDNDQDVNYCEFASLVKDIVDESLNND